MTNKYWVFSISFLLFSFAKFALFKLLFVMTAVYYLYFPQRRHLFRAFPVIFNNLSILIPYRSNFQPGVISLFYFARFWKNLEPLVSLGCAMTAINKAIQNVPSRKRYKRYGKPLSHFEHTLCARCYIFV